MFESGIDFYTSAKAETTVHFPENHVTCQYCHLYCKYEQNYDRYSCRLTGEWLLQPKKEIGHMCPLQFINSLDEAPGAPTETGKDYVPF